MNALILLVLFKTNSPHVSIARSEFLTFLTLLVLKTVYSVRNEENKKDFARIFMGFAQISHIRPKKQEQLTILTPLEYGRWQRFIPFAAQHKL